MVFTKDQTEKEIDEIHSKYRKLCDVLFICKEFELQLFILSIFFKTMFDTNLLILRLNFNCLLRQ